MDHDLSTLEKANMLSTTAFSDLSQKINARFSKLNDQNSKKKSRNRATNREAKQDAKRGVSQVAKQGVTRTKSKALSKPMRKSTQTGQASGKKRDSEGKIKDVREGNRFSSNSANIVLEPRKSLQREVYSLGGTDEDIELIADIDSDSELEHDGQWGKTLPPKKFDQGLIKGITDIVKKIDGCGRTLSPEPAEPEAKEGQKDNRYGNIGEDKPSNDHVSSNLVASQSHSGRPNLLITPRPDWFNVTLPTTSTGAAPNSHISHNLMHHIHRLHEHSKSLLEAENEAFKACQPSSSSHKFYSTVIASGTLSDKISALTLAVQESPIHNLRALEILINLGKKRSRAQAVDVLRAVKDLFAQGSLLPRDRKLYTFSAHPVIVGPFGSSKNQAANDTLAASFQPQDLIFCAYESWLKDKYFEVLQTLEIWCNDEIHFSRSRAIHFIFELLKEKPEQDSNLLRLLTNKLGDPVKKIASQASHLLLELMAAHAPMKSTIATSIESDLLFRPSQSLHAKYYATITLNQTFLSGKEEEVASKLLDIYFGLFAGLLKPVEVKKIASSDVVGLEARVKSKSDSGRKTSDEFDNTQVDDLREKLISAILTGINRAYPYTGSKAQSFNDNIETLFKITHSSNFNTSIQGLMLIQQLCSSHQAFEDRFYRLLYESLLDPRLLTSSKHALYLNLLYRALNGDMNVKRVTAFVKRVLQMLNLHQPPFICGCFVLVQRLRQQFPSLKALIDQPEENDLEDEMTDDVQRAQGPHLPSSGFPTNMAGRSHVYNSRKRDPEHSNAQNSCMWEIIPFLAHFHPTVSKNAEHIVDNVKLTERPDLDLHTLIHFLDRFVYRNAKVEGPKLRGSSVMQPLAGSNNAGLLVVTASHPQVPANSEKFRGSKREDVAAQDAFFHQYFNILSKPGQKKTKAKPGKSSNDDNGDASEEGESEIWQAMMTSGPDLDEVDDSDQDLDMSDLESATQGSRDDDSMHEEDGEEAGTFSGLVPSPHSQISIALSAASDNESGLDVSLAGKSARRHKIKKLPIFASASDYAAMLDDTAGEDQG